MTMEPIDPFKNLEKATIKERKDNAPLELLNKALSKEIEAFLSKKERKLESLKKEISRYRREENRKLRDRYVFISTVNRAYIAMMPSFNQQRAMVLADALHSEWKKYLKEEYNLDASDEAVATDLYTYLMEEANKWKRNGKYTPSGQLYRFMALYLFQKYVLKEKREGWLDKLRKKLFGEEKLSELEIERIKKNVENAIESAISEVEAILGRRRRRQEKEEKKKPQKEKKKEVKKEPTKEDVDRDTSAIEKLILAS